MPNARGEPRQQPERGTSEGCWRRLPGRADGSPSGPPTDPDVRNARIRCLRQSGCYPRKVSLAPQSTGLPWSGLVSSRSLPCLPPADTLPDGAFPPVGRLGLTAPPSPVLCAAPTATCPSRGPSLVARSPIPCLLPSCVMSLCGLVARRKLQGTPGPLVTRSPNPGLCSRRQVALPRSRVPPRDTCPALRPRWCPAHSPYRTQDCGLPVSGTRRLSSPSYRESYPSVHDYTHCGAQSRGLHPRYTRLRTAPDGEARGFATDRLARRESGGICTRWLSPTG